jgi:uncharacterized surface protein with fasciclin (FAS1) repeats
MSYLSTFTTTLRRTALAAGLVSLLGACATTPSPVSVVDTIATDPALSTLSGMIKSTGLTDTLKGDGPYTVFAPNNDAFKALPAKTQESLGKDAAALKAVLTYHVIASKTMAADVKNGKVKTVNGADLELSKAGDYVTVGDNALVTRANVASSNGVIHVVDAVLIPPAKK